MSHSGHIHRRAGYPPPVPAPPPPTGRAGHRIFCNGKVDLRVDKKMSSTFHKKKPTKKLNNHTTELATLSFFNGG